MPNEWEERLLCADGVTKPMIIQLAPAKTKSYSKERCSSTAERYSFHARINKPNVDGGSIPPTVPNQAILSKIEITATIKDAMAMALEM